MSARGSANRTRVDATHGQREIGYELRAADADMLRQKLAARALLTGVLVVLRCLSHSWPNGREAGCVMPSQPGAGLGDPVQSPTLARRLYPWPTLLCGPYPPDEAAQRWPVGHHVAQHGRPAQLHHVCYPLAGGDETQLADSVARVLNGEQGSKAVVAAEVHSAATQRYGHVYIAHLTTTSLCEARSWHVTTATSSCSSCCKEQMESRGRAAVQTFVGQ
ncbi:hypothetical protein ACK3TF_001647 [Chlorella vulgaris]